MVHFPVECDPRRLAATISEFVAIVPWSLWRRRVETLKSDLKRNRIWEGYILERHGLELALPAMRQHLRATGRLLWPPREAAEYSLASFMAMIVRVHANLSKAGKDRLAGALRSGLEKEAGLGPLAFEMKVVAHLMSQGFDVVFNDLDSGGGFDFLACRDGAKLEVECKYVSADIGRQIHRRKIYDLGGILQSVVSSALNGSTVGRLVRVTLPGRLTGERLQQEAIAGRIGSALAGECVSDPTVCHIAVNQFPIDGSIFDARRGAAATLDDVRTYIGGAFGLEESNILANWRPGQAAIIVYFESQAADKVLDEIFKRLKNDAKRQFSGSLPAFMCVHLADLTQHQLLELARAEQTGVTGIQRAISTLLNRRLHLYGVALMTDGGVRIARGNRHTRSVQESGPSYIFRNPDHPQANVPGLQNIFRSDI